MAGAIAFISRKSDIPSIGAMRKSVTAMSTPPFRTMSSAAFPSRAVSTTYPFAFSKLCRRRSIRGSSSTIKIFDMERIILQNFSFGKRRWHAIC